MKKYEFTGEKKVVFGVTLKQIVCVAAFASVAVGDVGGWIQDEKNLDHNGNAWVSGNARVSGDARVYGNAWVSGDARVYGDAWVSNRSACVWFSNVGSENGTLTICKSKTGLLVSRGCFSGPMDEFEEAVNKTHQGNKVAKEYKLLIEFAKLRMEVDGNA